MALGTFNDLLTSVNNWIDRDEINAALLDDFCALAERKMYEKLRVKELNTRLITQVEGLFANLPSDYLFGIEIREIGSEKIPLEYRTPQALDDTKTRGGNDKARLFTIRGTEIQFDQGLEVKDAETVTSLTSVTTTATLTTSANHGLKAGDYVTVSGANETEYNGTFEITDVPSDTTFTYTIVATTSPATGTISYTVNNVEVTYYKKFDGLREANQTNEILTNYPDVYLYGCLSKAGRYIQDREVLAQYQLDFLEAIDSANRESMDAEMSGSDMVMRTIIGFYNNQ